MSEQEQMKRAEAQKRDILQFGVDNNLNESDAFERWIRSGEAAVWADRWDKGEVQWRA